MSTLNNLQSLNFPPSIFPPPPPLLPPPPPPSDLLFPHLWGFQEGKPNSYSSSTISLSPSSSSSSSTFTLSTCKPLPSQMIPSSPVELHNQTSTKRNSAFHHPYPINLSILGKRYFPSYDEKGIISSTDASAGPNADNGDKHNGSYNKNETLVFKSTKETTTKWDKYSLYNSNNNKCVEKIRQNKQTSSDFNGINTSFHEIDTGRRRKCRRVGEASNTIDSKNGDHHDHNKKDVRDDDVEEISTITAVPALGGEEDDNGDEEEDDEEINSSHLDDYETDIGSKNGQSMECVVCGDKSSGKHYGQHTCEGCKSFFKRSVRRKLNYTCRGNRQCPIDIHHRNQCQYCRFQKCIKVGMRKEAVQQDRLPPFPSIYHPYYGLSNLLTSNIFTSMRHLMIGPNITQIINMLLYAERNSNQYLNNQYLVHYLNFILNGFNKTNSVSQSVTRTSEVINQSSVNVNSSSSSSNRSGGNNGENFKFSEIFNLSTYSDISSSDNAMRLTTSPAYSSEFSMSNSKSPAKYPPQNMDSNSEQSTVMNEITNSTLSYLFVIIEWARSIPLFTELQPSDQLILLINSWAELFILYLVQTCNTSAVTALHNGSNNNKNNSPINKTWFNSSMKIASLKQNSPSEEAGEFKQGQYKETFASTLEYLTDKPDSLRSHQRYSRIFQDQLEHLQQLNLDQSEYVCLKALILFNSEAPGLKDPGVIDSIQERIQCALEEHDRYHYSHYQPFRFGRLLLRLPKLKQTASSPSLLLWLQERFLPTIDYGQKRIEVLIKEIFEKSLSFQGIQVMQKFNPTFGQNLMSYLNPGRHSFLQPPAPAFSSTRHSLPSSGGFPISQSTPVSSEKLDKTSFPLFSPLTDCVIKHPNDVLPLKSPLSRYLSSICSSTVPLSQCEDNSSAVPFNFVNNHPSHSSSWLSDVVKSAESPTIPNSNDYPVRSKSMNDNYNSHEFSPHKETTYNGSNSSSSISSSVNVITSQSSPSLSPLSKISSSCSSINSTQTNNSNNNNKTYETCSISPLNNTSNVEHIESNKLNNELDTAQNNFSNYSNELFKNLLNSSISLDENEKNSQLQIYYTLLRQHLNSLLHNRTL
ncbi:unnamed protein product [Trichobilharzia szidati]|nr:unnamed protein product [Trichobilharzia szidati]